MSGWNGKRDRREWTRFEWADLVTRRSENRDEEMEMFDRGLIRMAKNNLYTVAVYVGEAVPKAPNTGAMVYLSIRRNERSRLPRDWRDLQRIKNEIVGPTHEGVEIFPTVERLNDEADQFHLWILATPAERKEEGWFGIFPFGFVDPHVQDHGTAEEIGGTQRPFPEGVSYHEPPLMNGLLPEGPLCAVKTPLKDVS